MKYPLENDNIWSLVRHPFEENVVKKAYTEALEKDYRFGPYGDAMLII